MLRTNSKKAIDNLKKWIIDNFNIDAVNKGDILEQTEEERNRYTEAEAEKCMTYLLYRTIKKGVIDKFLEA